MISKGLIITCSGVILGTVALTVVLVSRPSKVEEVNQEKSTEKKPEVKEDKIEVEVSEGKADKEEQIPSVKESVSETKIENYEQDLFANLPPNSIGSKFKDSLLGSSEDLDSWNNKLAAWKHGIETKKNDEPFISKSKQTPDLKLLQTRCQNSYKKTSWKEIKEEIARDKLKRDKYLSMIWTYCGRKDKAMPENWLESLD